MSGKEVSQSKSQSVIMLHRTVSRKGFHTSPILNVALLQSEVGTKKEIELQIILRKMLRNFPRNVRAFFSGSEKIQQTHTKSPCKSRKLPPTSFCRSAGGTNPSKIACAMLTNAVSAAIYTILCWLRFYSKMRWNIASHLQF